MRGQGYGYLFRASGPTAERDRQRAAECFLHAGTIDPTNKQFIKGLAELGLSPQPEPVDVSSSAAAGDGGAGDGLPVAGRLDEISSQTRASSETDNSTQVATGGRSGENVERDLPLSSTLTMPTGLQGYRATVAAHASGKLASQELASSLQEPIEADERDTAERDADERDAVSADMASRGADDALSEELHGQSGTDEDAAEEDGLSVDIVTWNQHNKDSSGKVVKPYVEFTLSVTRSNGGGGGGGGGGDTLVHHRFSSFKVLHQQLVAQLPHSGGELAASEAAKQLFAFSLMTW
eukprot:SAG22_NODE_287_length_12963_cov_21.279086_8_plen_294_part_00